MSGLRSNRWKGFALLFPIVGMAAATALAQGPGGQRGVFQAWYGVVANIPANPADIDGLEWWIDAADETSISLQAGTSLVTQWDDKSGNDKHLTQGTSSARPEWIEDELNGNAVIRFDGNNDSMSVPSSSALFNFLHQSNTTWFAVAKIGTNQFPGSNMALFDNTQFYGLQGAAFFYRSTGRLSRTNLFEATITRGLTSYVSRNDKSNTGVAGEYISMANISDVTATASNRSLMYINGTLHQDNVETQNVSAIDAQFNFTIADAAGNAQTYLSGDICEIIIYNGILSESDFNAVRSYLNNKWGIVY